MRQRGHRQQNPQRIDDRRHSERQGEPSMPQSLDLFMRGYQPHFGSPYEASHGARLNFVHQLSRPKSYWWAFECPGAKRDMRFAWCRRTRTLMYDRSRGLSNASAKLWTHTRAEISFLATRRRTAKILVVVRTAPYRE